MVVALYALGGIASLAGLLAVVAGALIDLSFGNTLIVSGCTGIVGGLIAIGQAATVRELRQLGRLLERPAQRVARPVDADGTARAPGRVAMPARAQPTTLARRPPEHRPEPIPPPERSALEPERLRPSSATGPRRMAEPPVVDGDDLAPLSLAGVGRGAQRPPLAGAHDEGMIEPRFEAPPPLPTPRFESPRPQEQERPKRNLFDTTWPSAAASGRRPIDREQPDQTQIEREQLDRAQLDRGQPDHGEPDHGQSDRGQPEDEPVQQPQTNAPADGPDEAAPSTTQDQARPTPAAILKSGVIDGMGYTLYTDGSIEAQLPSGIVRFESIEELRLHLEKNS
jgi:hypothetical protein